MNKLFKLAFNERNFHEVKDKYNISLPNHNNIIKGSFKQIDFVKIEYL